MVINQGDIYWVEPGHLHEPDTDIPHPYVIVQEDLLNHSRIHTVVACMLTTNLNRLTSPGNVLLQAGEANLPRSSVVEVAKISTIEKQYLGIYIGNLGIERMKQIFAGLRFVQRQLVR